MINQLSEMQVSSYLTYSVCKYPSGHPKIEEAWLARDSLGFDPLIQTGPISM